MNYKELNITGTSYRRSKFIKIDNPVNSTPSIYFVEEQVTTLNTGEILTKEVDQLLTRYDPLAVITIINPSTGTPTGNTMTHDQVYQVIYSIYMEAATKRDLG